VKVDGGQPAAELGEKFPSIIRSNQVVLQQMKRQFTRHAQPSGQAYPGRLAHPTIRADQAQMALRPGRTGPVDLLVDSEAAFLENRRLQRKRSIRHTLRNPALPGNVEVRNVTR
jgi:hypothetical protein